MFYNEAQKKRYIEQCPYEETTINTFIVHMFKLSYKVERYYQKDLSEFNQEEVIDLLKKVNSTSRNYLTSLCTFLSNYYEWCYKEKIIKDIDNKFSPDKTKMMIEAIIPYEVIAKQFFSKSVFLQYLDKIYNESDKLLAYCFYLGIKGKDFEEVVNLKICDLDEENKTIKLITGRIVEVDDYFIELMKKTNSAVYYDEDGTLMSAANRRIGLYKYISSEYVFKQMARGNANPLSMPSLNKKLKTIKKQANNRFLTVSLIYKNGLVNYIKEQYEKSGNTLKNAILAKNGERAYVYELQTQDYIDEFGANITVRQLRKDIVGFIDEFDKD
jgi:integrase